MSDLDTELKRAQIEHLRRQSQQLRWETPKAIAMIALALAAVVAAARLSDLWWPPKPLSVNAIVHLDGSHP